MLERLFSALLGRGDLIASIPFMAMAVFGLLVQESCLYVGTSNSGIDISTDVDIIVQLGISLILISAVIAAFMHSTGQEFPTPPSHKFSRGIRRAGG